MITKITADRKIIQPDHAERRFLKIRIRAPEAVAQERPRLNLAFVIDNSGSMQGRRLDLVKKALIEALGFLKEEDSFGVVSFSNETRIEVPLSGMGEDTRAMAWQNIHRIEPRGGTHLSAGWEEGVNMLGIVPKGAFRRVIMLTDGEANIGEQDPSRLGSLSRRARATGVTTTTYGVGNHFNEEILVEMSKKGGGNFYFIKDEESISSLVQQELQQYFDISVRDAKLEVKLPPGFKDVKVLSAFESKVVRGVLTIELGDLISNQEVSVFLELDLPKLALGDQLAFEFQVHARALEEPPSKEFVFEVGEGGELNERVVHQAWKMKVLGALSEAAKLNRNGNLDQAASLLQDLAHEALLGSTEVPRLREISMQLMEKAVYYGRRMAPELLKQQRSDSYSLMRSRNRDSSVRVDDHDWD